MIKILLVDDNPLHATLRKSILEGRFAEVQRVGDAAEAFCLMEQPQFSEQLGLVISGLNLPGIGGPAFVAELHERLPGIPILVLGAPGEDAANYKGAWVRFLPGPFGGEQLLKAANDLLTQNV